MNPVLKDKLNEKKTKKNQCIALIRSLFLQAEFLSKSF